MNHPRAHDVQDNRRVGGSSNHLTSAASAADLAASQRVCRQIARSHYENFLVASILVPRPMRQHFFNVYAICRTADDLADQPTQSRPPPQHNPCRSGAGAGTRDPTRPPLPSAAEVREQLDALQRQLDDTFRGHPPGGILIALADTIERFDLRPQPFNDLFEAFRQDQRRHGYDTFGELHDYCRHSANPVGRIVLQLSGCDQAANREFSDHLCTGLQLTNFWQDVGRDHAIGRVYLPRDAMDRYGVSSAMLGRDSAPRQLRELLSEQCRSADSFLRAGLPLADQVPRWLAAQTKLFAHGGLATLNAIRRIDFDVLASRPTVSRWQQARLLGRALIGRL